jgi:ATP-dependent 26S proteasome regulatory subunit
MMKNRYTTTMSTTATIANNGIVNSYVNQSINMEMMKHMRSIIDSKQFTMKNLLIILGLLGIDSIRTSVNAALGSLFQSVYNGLHAFAIRTKKYILVRIRGPAIPAINLIDISDVDSKHESDISTMVSSEFYNLLTQYIILNRDNNCRYTKTLDSIQALDSESGFEQRARLSNISIQHNNHTINMVDDIACVYDERPDGTIIIGNVLKTAFDTSDYTKNRLAYYLLHKLPLNKKQIDFIYDGIRNHVDANTSSASILKYGQVYNTNQWPDDLMDTLVPNGIGGTYRSIVTGYGGDFNILSTWINFGMKRIIDRDVAEVAVLYVLLIKIIIEAREDAYLPKNFIIFKIQVSHAVEKHAYPDTLHRLYDRIFNGSVMANKIYNHFNVMNMIGENACLYSAELNAKYFTLCSNNNYLYTTVMDSENHMLDRDDSNAFMKRFISHVKAINFVKKNGKQSIVVYNVQIKVDMNTIQNAQEAKTIKKTMEDGTIEETVVCAKPASYERKIEVSFVELNEMFKSFESLYLKKADEFRLKSILSSFNKRKDIYKKLCIPFKFNCILYGPPGSGKTSTIKAIASYLGKDIFYLDISKVRCNEDLTEIFKKIYTNKSFNGIVVMEDIDCCASDVVLSRDDGTNNSNDGLTLSHLLNVLDGSLTRDDSVVLMTTNHFDKLDSALVRAGRMDLAIKLDYCDAYQFTTIYRHILGRALEDDQLDRLTVIKITPAQFIYGLLPYIESDVSTSEILDGVIQTLH